MIEINLLPDIKQEFIKAKKTRNMVISGSIIVGVISIALVVLLVVYLYGVQNLRSTILDKSIDDKELSLEKTPDLSNMLTLQSQLSSIKQLHDQNSRSSRIFSLLTAINPAAPNNIVFSNVKLDTNAKTIRIDAQAASGFVAADILKKTIKATTFSYNDQDKKQPNLIAKNDPLISDMSYGEDSSGLKVLRFSISFEYDDAVFASTSKNLIISQPDRKNATDSRFYLPTNLFGSRADDVGSKK